MRRSRSNPYLCGAVTAIGPPRLQPRLLDFQEQFARLPEQLAEPPAFRNSLANEEPVLERVPVAGRSTGSRRSTAHTAALFAAQSIGMACRSGFWRHSADSKASARYCADDHSSFFFN